MRKTGRPSSDTHYPNKGGRKEWCRIGVFRPLWKGGLAAVQRCRPLLSTRGVSMKMHDIARFRGVWSYFICPFMLWQVRKVVDSNPKYQQQVIIHAPTEWSLFLVDVITIFGCEHEARRANLTHIILVSPAYLGPSRFQSIVPLPVHMLRMCLSSTQLGIWIRMLPFNFWQNQFWPFYRSTPDSR
jgi:hypothetical protein